MMLPPCIFAGPAMARNMKPLQIGGILILKTKAAMLIISEIDGVKPCEPAGDIRGQRASTLLQPQTPEYSLAKIHV
jgi:hypothetical protein